jgi:hypothetical protein
LEIDFLIKHAKEYLGICLKVTINGVKISINVEEMAIDKHKDNQEYGKAWIT